MIDALKSKTTLIVWILLFILAGLFVFINLPFLGALILAGIFALGMHDSVRKLSARFHIRYGIAVFAACFLALTLLWVPLSLAIYRIVVNLSNAKNSPGDHLMDQAQALKQSLMGVAQKLNDFTGTDMASHVSQIFENTLRQAGQWLIAYSSTIIAQIPGLAFQFFIFLVFILVLLMKAESIKNFTLKYSLLDDELTESMVRIFKSACEITLFSTFAVGLIQAAVVGTGSLLFGNWDFWLVVTITFVCTFIPFIGAGPVGATLAVLAFMQDNVGAAVGLAVVALIAGTIDNVLKPYLAGGKGDNKIPAMIAFTCVVGAVIMMGIPGLLLGPVIMNLVYEAVPLLLKHLKTTKTP